MTAPASAAGGVAERYRDPARAAAGVSEPPFGSLAGGAAGVAYFLLRHASLGGDAASLAAAREWAWHADRATEDDPEATAMQYGEAGARWVAALVGAVAGDADLLHPAAARFSAIAGSAIGAPGDVTHGSAGLLLGCAQLLDSADEGELREVGDRLAFELAAFADRQASGDDPLEYLGVAHGWAGVAHALLRWSHATGGPPSATAIELLERLIPHRRRSGRWPVRSGSRTVYRGWCHGTAGWAQMWALAWQQTGDERYLGFARDCAQDAADAHDEEGATLCCGRAGQGFAALTLYRATGEESWLTAAKQAAVEAAQGETDGAAHRLFTGDLGVALLALELEDPGRSAMPYFEPIT